MKYKSIYIYIMTNEGNTVFYTGVTNDLVRRVYQHKNKVHPKSFTSKYNIEKLVYYEYLEDAIEAIKREKVIKGGSRADKVKLIYGFNPKFRDLYAQICGCEN